MIPVCALAEDSLPMDPSVMRPWLSSCIIGMVTKDTRADCLDDYYLFVNHDWILNAKLYPGYSSETGMIHKTMRDVRERCIALLTDSTLTGRDAELIQAYYELFLDWDARNEAGLTPFLPAIEKLQKIGTLEQLSEFLLSDDNFLWGVFPADVYMESASSDSSVYEVNIAPQSLILGDSTGYDDPSTIAEEEGSAFGEVCRYMLGRIGTEEQAQTIIDNALRFEARLAAHIISYEEDNDPASIKKKINPVTMEDLKELSPVFPLCEYLEKYGWAESTLINLTEPEWLVCLNGTYTEENFQEIKDWVLTKLLDRVIKLADEDAYRTWQKIMRREDGIEESATDEEVAYEACISKFPDEFARLYVEKHITVEDRREIEELCQAIIETYRDMLSETEWLSSETRRMAIEKLDSMVIWALYPDKWEDESMFSITPKEEGGSFALANMEYTKAEHLYYLAYVNQAVDREIWDINILVSNATYRPSRNAFCIHAGFLGDAVWRHDMSIEEKYGTIGSVIAHEISHAFDSNGAQYDKDGSLANWWKPEDYRVFAERTQKLVDWYDQVVVLDDGTKYSGTMVQAEAIADMAGMKCMLKMAEKIDGFDYDRFFRSNAAMWARIDTLPKTRLIVKTDGHPLNYLRVNATVQQFDEFLETYGVKEGDGMYLAPEERIAVW